MSSNLQTVPQECPKCKCKGLWSLGHVLINTIKKKRWKCKSCEYQFTKQEIKGYSEHLKLNVISSLKNGNSIRSTGRIFNISMETVRRWKSQLSSKIINANIINYFSDSEQYIDEITSCKNGCFLVSVKSGKAQCIELSTDILVLDKKIKNHIRNQENIIINIESKP